MFRPSISRTSRLVLLLLLCPAIIACIVHLRKRRAEKRSEVVARAAREATYVQTAASLTQVIRPGMSRKDVEQFLRSRSLPFTLRSGTGTHDEIVPLAHEPSPLWACNWEQVQLLIAFAPAGTAIPSAPDSTGFSQAAPEDRVKHAALDHWQRDCM